MPVRYTSGIRLHTSTKIFPHAESNLIQKGGLIIDFLTAFTAFSFVSAVFHFLSTCSSQDEQPVPFPCLWTSQQYSLVLIIWKRSQRKPPRHLPPSTNTSPAHNPQAEQSERSWLVTLRGDWSNLTLSDGESWEEVVLHLGKERTIQPSHGDASAGTCSDSIRHSGQHAGASARLWRTDQVGEIKRKWFDVRTWWRIMGSSFEQQPVVRGYKLWLICSAACCGEALING